MQAVQSLSDTVKALFYPDFAVFLERTLKQYGARLQEIRIRRDRPASLSIGSQNFFITKKFTLTQEGCDLWQMDGGTFDRLLCLMCENSLYAKEKDIAGGFITLGNGCRVGLAGRAVLEGDLVKSISNINLLSIRLTRELKGCADELMHELLWNGVERLPSALLVSPPKFGKTTILRDLCRQLSAHNLRVVLIDEKNEVAGMVRGSPSYDIGALTDVMTDIPKSTGILCALRNLSPQVIICDEIGAAGEVDAVLYGIHAGVPMILTCHSNSFEQVKKRAPINRLLDSGAVTLIASMNAKSGVGRLNEVIRM